MKQAMRVIRILMLAVLLPPSPDGLSQDEDSALVERFRINNQDAYRERIYVHLDRQYYLAGEMIRFTIFCLEPGSCRPSPASSVACIELVDPRSRSINRKKIALHRGIGTGLMEIPLSCKSQEYILRCYTAWQRNSGSGAYYYNNILILHPSKPVNFTMDTGTSTDLKVNFYPEGGHLVPGLVNHVVFSAHEDGRIPVQAGGEILMDDSVRVTRFQTSWPGIGSFRMVPEKGRKYTAWVSDTAGNQTSFHLPLLQEDACGIELKNEPDGRRTLLIRPHSGICDTRQTITLIAWNPRRIGLIRKMKADTLIQHQFEDHRFSPGINYLTLVDKKKHILAERSFFVEKEASLEIRAIGLEGSYTSRETVTFSLETLAPEGLSTNSRLSVSVSCSGNDLPHSHSNSFRQSVLLGGEVPELFAWQSEDISPGGMDLYMIIHSAGKCSWLEDRNVHTMYIPELKGPVVSGKITRKGSGSPAGGQELCLSFIDSIPHFYSTCSDEEGYFHFAPDHLEGTREMVVQVHGKGNVEEFQITMEDDFAQDPLPEFSFSSLQKAGLQQHFEKLLLHRQLAGAYAHMEESSTMVGSFPPGSDPAGSPGHHPERIPFYGKSDHQIIMEEFIALPVMEEVFRELGKRIFLVREQGKYLVRLLDLKTNRIIGDEPFYFIDGVPVFDSEILMDLDPSRVHSIRLKSQRYFIKNTRMDGIVDIRTTGGEAEPVPLPPSAIRQRYQGFSAYEPAVSVDSLILRDPRIPLFLTTPCFESSLTSSPGQPATVRFPAPDSKGQYDIVVKALDENGRIGEKRYTIQIQ